MVITILGSLNSRQISNFLVITLLFISLFPIQSLLSDPQLNIESTNLLTPLSNSAPIIPLDRLLGKEKSVNSQQDPLQPNAVNINGPMYAIGDQTGVGKSYAIFETLNISSTESLSLLDASTTPETHEDTFLITPPSGFTNTTGWMNISDVIPDYDWRHIENDRTAGSNFQLSSSADETFSFLEVAMQFNVTEPFVNLSSVRIHRESVQDPDTEQNPTGEIIIFNGTKPSTEWEVNENDPLGSVSLSLGSSSWVTYSFANDIVLRGDWSYFLLMNDTTTGIDQPDPAHWKWGAQKDPIANDAYNDSLDEGLMWFKTSHGGSWFKDLMPFSSDTYDLNLRIEVKPVEFNGSNFVNREYSTPNQLNLRYNTTTDETALSSFNWFEWNATSSNSHTFKTNTS